MSIDTYAKVLYLKGDLLQLDELKLSLLVFFSLWQTKRRHEHQMKIGANLATEKPVKMFLDNRYENFFASLFDDRAKILDHVKIITWNYDCQMEMTLYSMMRSSVDRSKVTPEVLRSEFGILEKLSDDNHIAASGIAKLNGSATLNNNIFIPQYRFPESYEPHDFKTLCKYLQEVITTFRLNRRNDPRIGISFAWEQKESQQNNLTKLFIDKIKKMIEGTTELVVIGYSFPMFNRNVDRELFGNIPLQRIHIQDPNATSIKDRMGAIRRHAVPDKVNLSTDTYQFLFPESL